MSIELIGLITLVAGLLVIRSGPDFGIAVLMIATLLGAAAAIKLPALGGASILPAHALLPFYLLALIRQPGAISDAIRSLAFPGPGFWFAAFVIYGFISALILPRLFAGVIDVVAIDRDAGGIFVMPLAPGSGNITQPVYLAGDLALYAAVVAHTVRNGLSPVVRAVFLAAAVNLCFGVLDLATYAAGMSSLLDFIRNANYAMLVEGEIEGFKRLVGSFPEASAFGAVTLMYFAFCFEVWLRGAGDIRAGVLALLSLAAVLACTSSSAYVGLGVYLSAALVRCAASLTIGNANARATFVAAIGPLLVLTILLTLMMLPNLWEPVSGLVDRTLINKLDTQSGIERSMWNEVGLRVFFDSSMLGVGVGSLRTSSFLVAILATTGLAGAFLMAAFFIALGLQLLKTKEDGFAAAASAGAGGACFALFTTASLVAASVDMGLSFFIAAGLISGAACRSAAASSRPAVSPATSSCAGVDPSFYGPMRIGNGHAG